MSVDIVAVEQTLAAYCHRVDSGTADEVAELFATDAVLMPYYDGDYDVNGREGIREWYTFYLQQMNETVNDLRHSVSTALVQVSQNTASSVCNLSAYFRMKTDNRVYQAQGNYHDTLVRSEGSWLFQTRRIEVQYVTCMGDAIARMKPMGFPGASQT